MYSNQQSQIAFASPAKLFTPGVVVLLILMFAGLLLYSFATDFTLSFLALSKAGIMQGRVWQLVTYVFVSGSPRNLVFSGLMVLFVGSSVEREWKTRSFVMLWVVISAGSGLLWVIMSIVTNNNFVGTGATACSYGLLATMGILYRGRRFFMFFVTVEAKYLVLIFIGIGILMNLFTPINMIWIAGAPIAYGYVKLRWNLMAKNPPIYSQQREQSRGFVDID